MNKSNLPKVAVLLAAYNGEKYIEEQIHSILNQKYVQVHIYINIDKSSDKTKSICDNIKEKYHNISIIKNEIKIFGSAANNFYYIFKKINLVNFDYVSLSDQDDLWKAEKILTGINSLKKNKSHGYSSDVECFWENGKKNKIIKKSYPQKKYDYFFEPAGPGCTYLLDRKFAIFVQEKIKSTKNNPRHHDWYIYALARAHGYKWTIDNNHNILYRQHTSNQVGANVGLAQKIKRFKKLLTGEFNNEVMEIIKISNSEYLKNKNIRREIIKDPFSFRRNNLEAILLLFCALAGLIKS
jgi:rhamnosyltransferase